MGIMGGMRMMGNKLFINPMTLIIPIAPITPIPIYPIPSLHPSPTP
jgi:hypothetical protein